MKQVRLEDIEDMARFLIMEIIEKNRWFRMCPALGWRLGFKLVSVLHLPIWSV